MGDKSVEKTYQKKTQLEHILLRPDTYVGSTEKLDQTLWVFDEKTQKFKEKEISYAPGLYKIFGKKFFLSRFDNKIQAQNNDVNFLDEILVNAADNIQRDPKGCTSIKVNVDKVKGSISVLNNGKTIPVVIHKEHKMYVPEMVFGHLLTSSNYDDSEKKTTGGRNGFGAKLTNIFSKKFTVEVGDSKSKKHYVQEFSNNMHNIGEPKIKEYSADKNDYTIVSFEPDFKRFGMKSLDDEIISLFKKRVYDLAGISPKLVKVYFNGEKIDINSFEDYTNLYFNSKQSDISRFCEKFGNRWEVCVAIRDFEQFQQVSFVNGICTIRGGTHVNHVSDQIVNSLLETVLKKNKKLTIKPFQIKSHLWVFVNCLIENPAFDSQTKETLTSRPNTFGSKCEISDKFLMKIAKSGVIEEIIQRAEQKEQNKLKRELGTGTKKKKLFGIPKLEDANWAGTQDSDQCILILTEGDSAKSLAMSGIQVVGRDKYGVFPLRGKLLNVREASNQQVLQNQEIQSIIKILGLYIGRQYETRDDLRTLRYGSIMIMADQDHDGSHIKGLIINFIHHFWPSLLKNFRNFVKVFITPIIKVSKEREQQQFFTIPEYEKWAKTQDLNELRKYRVKYYKGLGTSTALEAKQYFSSLNKHQIQYYYQNERDEEKIMLAFSKSKVDDRKEWLSRFNPHNYIDYSKQKITYQEFVDNELIHFSNADNMRSIPSVMDGLKPGQRKIIFGCFKRKLKNEIKVAQLSGYIAEHSAYHHGEVSLQSTIVIMAQDFVGSNNLNLLMPIGQFGTRMLGGKESASPRYIFTNLSPFTRMIFNENDDPLLNYQIEEGLSIEPEYYAPIVPMVLINGAEGIGTGWSTWIPCYSPIQIIHNLKRHLDGKPFLRMVPWYKGFRGEIIPNDEEYLNFTVRGKYSLDEYKKKLYITELPIGKWTRDYKNMLEDMAQKEEILDIKEFHQDNTVDFQIKCSDAILKLPEAELTKKFKLTSTLNATNLVLFDKNYKLKKYENECQILQEFFDMRLQLYHKRKENMLKQINQQFEKMSNKYRFIEEIMDGSLNIYKKKKEEILKLLRDKGYKTYEQIYGRRNQNVLAVDPQNESSSKDGSKSKKDQKLNKSEDFNYLLEMKIYSFVEDQLISLKAKMDEIGRQKAELESKSPKDLWNEDLDQLLEKYQQSLSQEELRHHRSLMTQKQREYSPSINASQRLEQQKSTPLFIGEGSIEEVKQSNRLRRNVDDGSDQEEIKQSHRSVIRVDPEIQKLPITREENIISRKVIQDKIQTPSKNDPQKSKNLSSSKQQPQSEGRSTRRPQKLISYKEKDESSEEEYDGSSDSSDEQPQSSKKSTRKLKEIGSSKRQNGSIRSEGPLNKKAEVKANEKNERKMQIIKQKSQSFSSSSSGSQSDYQEEGKKLTKTAEIMKFYPQRQTRQRGATANVSAPAKLQGNLTPMKSKASLSNIANSDNNKSSKKMNQQSAGNLSASPTREAKTVSRTIQDNEIDLELEFKIFSERNARDEKTIQEKMKFLDSNQISQTIQEQTNSSASVNNNEKPKNLLDRIINDMADRTQSRSLQGQSAIKATDTNKVHTKQSTLNFSTKPQPNMAMLQTQQPKNEEYKTTLNDSNQIQNDLKMDDDLDKSLKERLALKMSSSNQFQASTDILNHQSPEKQMNNQEDDENEFQSPANPRRKLRKIVDDDEDEE